MHTYTNTVAAVQAQADQGYAQQEPIAAEQSKQPEADETYDNTQAVAQAEEQPPPPASDLPEELNDGNWESVLDESSGI